jgi:hypothetical protein
LRFDGTGYETKFFLGGPCAGENSRWCNRKTGQLKKAANAENGMVDAREK